MKVNRNCTCGKTNLTTRDFTVNGIQRGLKRDFLLGTCKSCKSTIILFKGKEDELVTNLLDFVSKLKTTIGDAA